MSEFIQYERDNDVEARFGSPDFDAWTLYLDAIKTTTKGSLVVAYHLISAASGLSIDKARSFLNTYTLANYEDNGNTYINDARKNKNHYSEPARFGYLYDLGEVQDKKAISMMLGVLNTSWAQYVCQNIGIDMQDVQDYADQFSCVIHIFNTHDKDVWIPVSKSTKDYPPRAFLPFKRIDGIYIHGYKAEPTNSQYFNALVNIQTAYINNETKVFITNKGKKEERQKKAKWRHGAEKGSPLLGPTLGWIKVPKEDLETLDVDDLANKIIEAEEGIAECDSKPKLIRPVLCSTQEEISEKVHELMPLVNKGVPLGQKNPEKHETTSMGYIRDAAVVAYVLLHAQGKCESCQQDAPFIKESTEEPFLEVHHVKPLAEGGSDTITNAIAICPNCHRELHHGVNKYSLNESIYSRNTRLEME